MLLVNSKPLLIPAATPPQITSQPTSLEEIPTGKPVTFSIQTTGTKLMNYQWQCWKPEGEEDESKAWQDLTCDGVKFQEVKAGLKFMQSRHVMQATIGDGVVSNSAGSENSQCASLVVGKSEQLHNFVRTSQISTSFAFM